MLKREAWAIVGGLSNPGKMPCKGYSIPASACILGTKLREIKGSTCEICYAMKGQYVFPVVQRAMERRLESLKDPRWEEPMVTLIKGKPFFRWHDSGDLQGLWHLEKIAFVARQTPGTKHWLPTRERWILRAWAESGATVPRNLIIRESTTRRDHLPKGPGLHSMVYEERKLRPGTVVRIGARRQTVHVCPAPKQGNECRDCRKCWDRKVRTVAYRAH